MTDQKDSQQKNEVPGKLPPPASQSRDKTRSMTKEEGRRIHREKMRSLGSGLTLQFGDNVFEEPSPEQNDIN